MDLQPIDRIKAEKKPTTAVKKEQSSSSVKSPTSEVIALVFLIFLPKFVVHGAD